MPRLTLMIVLVIIGSCLMNSNGSVQISNSTQQNIKPCPELPRSPFRYVITWNKITEGTYYPEGGKYRARGVNVLLDEKSFSESTLRHLFALISKRFPDPDELRVSVYTSLEDMSTPEEDEQVQINCTRDFATFRFPPAYYSRDGKREQFVYQAKDQPGVLKTIVLRGKE